MKKHHAPSFFFSIIVHILALLIFFYTYKYVVYLNHKKAQQKVCINLNLCIPKHATPIKKVKKIEEVKKVLPKKVLPKKVLPKKIVPKKVKKKRVTPPKIKPALVVPIVKKKIVKPKKIEKKIEEKIEEKVVESKEIEQESIVEQVAIKNDTEESKSISEPINTKVDIAIRQKKEYINNNLQKISKLLSDNLYYPRRARKRGIVGEVVVSFNILQDGSVNEVNVISSNSKILSKAARETIENLSGKFPKPSQDLSIQIPINYSLH